MENTRNTDALPEDVELIQAWVEDYFSGVESKDKNLVGALQDLQAKFGYLPKAGMKQIAGSMGITPVNVYSVATFYNQFRFVPPGKYDVKVCMGTACVIKQGQLILDHWQRQLGIKTGQVTEDREYSLDRVDCVGCCTLAPVTVIGDEVIGEMAVTKVDGFLLQHKLKREREAVEKEAADE